MYVYYLKGQRFVSINYDRSLYGSLHCPRDQEQDHALFWADFEDSGRYLIMHGVQDQFTALKITFVLNPCNIEKVCIKYILYARLFKIYVCFCF